MQSHYLFFSGRESLGDVLSERLAKALAAVERINGDRLLATPDRDVFDAVLAEFEVEVPAVQVEGQYSSGVRETKVEVTDDFRYSGRPDRRTIIDGSEISWHLPVSGFGPAFTHSASTRSLNPPQGDYLANEIVLSQTVSAHEVQSNEAIGDVVRRRFDEQVREIVKLVRYASNECTTWNEQLRQQLQAKIDARKKKLLADRNLEAALGINISPRPDPPAVAINLEQRRRLDLTSALRSPASPPFAPEPEVVDADFRAMIDVTLKWREAVERLPDTYGPMDEEALRDSLLILLNGTFVWAGGEVFQRKGKTDIVVPYMHSGRTAMSFVAELKFWSGPKNFLKAIDQLLGYVIWRNTKAMLVLLVRDKDATKVNARARDALCKHGAFKHADGDIGEDGQLVTLAHPEDAARELKLAFIPAVVPAPTG